MRCYRLALVVAALFPLAANAAGVARNQNFSVYVPDTSIDGQAQRFAEFLIERAQQYRTEIAQEWLGAELPQRLLVTVRMPLAIVAGASKALQRRRPVAAAQP